MSLTYSTYRATSHDIHGRDIGWFQTMPKLYMTELAGRIAKLARDIVEDDFTDMGGARLKWIERFMISLSMSIAGRSEEHTSELQSLMRISYAVFCLKKKILTKQSTNLTRSNTIITQ